MTMTGSDIALILGGIGTLAASLSGVYLQIRAARLAEKNKGEAIAARDEQNVILKQAAAGVDGINTELNRQNVALKLAVASPEQVPEQVAGAEGNAPVGQDKGVVTVEKKAPE